jgi:hypothetical protein
MNSEQSEEDGGYSYIFTGDAIFYFRKTARADYYRNTVRLKVNMPVSLEKQEIWRYDDPPVFYDEKLKPYYPFRSPLVREIENGNYEAIYYVIDVNGKERNVIFADDIDCLSMSNEQLAMSNGNFFYSQYDVTTHHDRAILKLSKESDGDLYRAAIYGRPIVLDLNRSCFIRDIEQVNTFGTVALNVTGSYFSEYIVLEKSGITISQYEDWVTRELAERIQKRREFTVKTHKALFNARVGAKVQIKVKKEESEGVVTMLSFRYKRDAAFVASFRITETGGNYEGLQAQARGNYDE